MNKKIISSLKYSLFLGFSIALLYFALKDISLEEFIVQLGRTEYKWLFLSLSVALISHVARAYRWVILLEPIGYKPKLSNTFFAVMIGYFANLAFPRAGEVTRCAMLKKTDDIPVDASFGTVITERLFDLIVLIFLILINVLIEKQLKSFLWDQFGEKLDAIMDNSVLIIVLISTFFIGLIIIYLLRDKIIKNPLFLKIKGILSGLLEGLLSFSKVKRKAGFMISTFVMWFCYWAMLQVAVLAYPESVNFGFVETFTLLIVGGLAMSAPVQGGIGAYHYLVGSLLTLYGLSNESGIALATILHSSQMFMMIVIGGISLIFVLIKESNLKKINNENS